MRMSSEFCRSFDIRTTAGSSTSIPSSVRRAIQASVNAASPSPLTRMREIGAADGVAATSSAAGIATDATQNKSLELGTIIKCLPGYGDLMKNLLDHFDNAESFDLELRSKNQAVFQNRNRHRFHVVWG